MNVLELEPVVRQVLADTGVKRSQTEDFTQECFLALLENPDRDPYAVCKERVYSLWNSGIRSTTQRAKIESLDDPRVFREVMKKSVETDGEISESELNEGILSLPLDQYRVIYSLYVDGRTEEQTAADLGLTRESVRSRKRNGIKNLKRKFEVEDGRL